MAARQQNHSQRRQLLAATTLGLCTLFTGCQLSELPEQQATIDAALPESTSIPQHWATPTADQPVLDGWLQSFNDPTLIALVDEALANNPDLLQAAAVVEIARQNTAVVNSQLLPQVGANGMASWFKDEGHSGWHDSQKAGGLIGWEADVWGRLRAQKSAAEFTYQATALDYAYARQSLAATVAKSWYTTIKARRVMMVAENAVTIFSDLLDLVEVQRDNGKVGDLNVAESKADLNEAKGTLKLTQGLYSEARRNLQRLLGRYPDAEIETAQDFTPVPPPVRADLPSSLLERRPDLIAAQTVVLSAFRAKESAELERLPNFSLNVSGGYLNNDLLSDLHLDSWMLKPSVGMSVPIYEGGRIEAQVQIANAQQQQATAAYGSAILDAFREVENALTNEILIAERLDIQIAELKDRVESVRIATIQYKAGSIDLLSLLQLQSYLLNTQSKQVKLQSLQLTNRIDLHLALGGNFEE